MNGRMAAGLMSLVCALAGCGGGAGVTPEPELDVGSGEDVGVDASAGEGADVGEEPVDVGMPPEEDAGRGADADEGCHELTFEGGFNGRIEGASSQCVAATQSSTPVEAIPRSGFTFRAWSDGSTDNPRVVSNPSESATLTAEFETRGLTTVWLGHSFVRWNVELLYDVAKNDAGYAEHADWMTFSGGATGAPGSLWDDPGKRTSGQAMIREQQPDNVVMTYHPSPGTSDYEDYANWVDYTLQHAPDARFYIALPWPSAPFGTNTLPAWLREDGAEDLEALYDTGPFEQLRGDLVARLRAAYPDSEFVVIPQIIAADEVIKAHFAGTLTHDGASGTFDPLKRDGGAPNEHEESLFHDRTGHPGGPIRLLTMMLYMRYVYGVEVGSFGFWSSKASFLNEGLEGPAPKETFDVPYAYYDGFDFPAVADEIFIRYGRGE